MTTPHPTLVPLPSSPSSVTSGVSSPSSSRSRSAFSSPVSPLNVSTSRSRPRLSRNVTTGTTATIRLGNTTVEQQDPFYESSTVSVNQPVGSLSISPSSRDVCLASRKGLYILDLGNLNNAPRFIPQGGTWQIADCQWSPHPVTSNLILSTSSQKLLVWDLSAQKCLYRQIDAHARAITDINWHARNPNLMATVGMDAGIRGCDLRAWDKPFMRVCAWGVAGTQIKWNRQHEHIFATAHGKEVLIWDDRKGSVPVVVIKAHDAKIYGIDWDREHRHKLVTCSLDKTIKYWTVPELSSQVANADVEFYHSLPAPSTPTHTISTSYPVWRARNLPFGHGVLALPQRGQEDLDMFGYSSSSQPAQTFEGHDDVVKEFVWRSRGGEDSSCEDREFQLVTWSKDRTLRIWPVAPDILERVGYKYGAPIKVLQSRKGAPDITYTQVGKPQPSDEQPSARPLPLLPLPVVNPSGISKQKMAKLETAMTRGGGVKAKGMDQLEWLTKVVKNKASPDSSHINSRAASRTRFGSRGTSGERRTESERDKGEWISLKDEVVLVHKIFPRPKINFEKIDLAHRKLTISMNGPWANGNRMAFMRIHWSFPSTYPYTNDVPTFELERNPTVSPITRQKLIATIKEMRAANRQCLVATSAFLLGSHERVGRRLIEDDSDSESEKDVNVQLANVPMLIRTCGATFGPNGQLVCFFPKQTVLPRTRQLSRSPSVPREFQKNPLLKAMSALSRFDNPRQRNAIRIKPRLRKFENLLAPVQAGSTMTIHDVSHLGNPDLDLARSYGVSLSPERNLQKAFEHKKLHHAEIWSALIGLLSDPPPPPYSVMPPTQQDRDMGERREREAWERGVARKKLVLEQIFENLAAGHDIQLFALVACILLDHVKKTPAPPRPSPLLTHSPAQDYFALPRHQLSRPSSQTYLPSLVNTPLRKRSSLTPVSPGLIGSSYRTSGFSQVFSNSNFSRAGGSSLSLRNSGAITPTHRSSFDIQPMSSDFAMSNNDSPPVLLSPGITMPVPVRRPGASPRYRDRPYRMSSGVVIAESPSAISSLRNTTASANNSANLPGDNSAKGCDVRPTSEASRSLTAGPQAPSSGTNTSGSRVTFDSVSPFRRGLSRVSTNMSAQSGPTQAYPKDSDKRNRRVCSVRIEFDNDSIEPPSLLDHETRITCELVKLAYADFLLRSDLLGIRTALMQYNFLDPADPTIDALSAAHGTVHISAHQRQSQLHSVKQICVGCGASQEQCPSCKQAPVKPVCVYCRLPIKGIATTCVMCTHRTHAKCFKIHFGASGSPTCPSCSCTCVKNGGVTGHLLPIPQNAAGMSSPVKPEVTKGLARGNNTLPLAGGTGRMTYATLKTIRESSLGDQGDAMVGLGLSPEGTKQTHTGSSEDSSAGGSGMASGWLTWDPARLPWAGSGTGGNAGSETAGMDSEGDEAVKQAGRGKGAEGILARTRLSTAFRSSDGRARSKGR